MVVDHTRKILFDYGFPRTQTWQKPCQLNPIKYSWWGHFRSQNLIFVQKIRFLKYYNDVNKSDNYLLLMIY